MDEQRKYEFAPGEAIQAAADAPTEVIVHSPPLPGYMLADGSFKPINQLTNEDVDDARHARDVLATCTSCGHRHHTHSTCPPKTLKEFAAELTPEDRERMIERLRIAPVSLRFVPQQDARGRREPLVRSGPEGLEYICTGCGHRRQTYFASCDRCGCKPGHDSAADGAEVYFTCSTCRFEVDGTRPRDCLRCGGSTFIRQVKRRRPVEGALAPVTLQQLRDDSNSYCFAVEELRNEVERSAMKRYSMTLSSHRPTLTERELQERMSMLLIAMPHGIALTITPDGPGPGRNTTIRASDSQREVSVSATVDSYNCPGPFLESCYWTALHCIARCMQKRAGR
jgi:hypothetical protein